MPNATYPQPLEELIDLLKTFPGVGAKGAERMAFSILKWQPGKVEAMSENLATLQAKVTPCPECGNLASEGALCRICSAPSRDVSVMCIVENPIQIINIEKSAFFRGIYHVLGGKLAPLDGKDATSLSTVKLLERIDASTSLKEIIIALSPDVEGQATTLYLANMLDSRDIKITKLAQGLPAGSDISYADCATIAAALNGRTLCGV